MFYGFHGMIVGPALAALGYLAVGFTAFLALSAAFNGVVIYLLWDWFLVSAGLPAVTLAEAIGIALVAHLLTLQFSDIYPKDELGDWFMRALLFSFFRAVITLGVGAVAYQMFI